MAGSVTAAWPHSTASPKPLPVERLTLNVLPYWLKAAMSVLPSLSKSPVTLLL